MSITKLNHIGSSGANRWVDECQIHVHKKIGKMETRRWYFYALVVIHYGLIAFPF